MLLIKPKTHQTLCRGSPGEVAAAHHGPVLLILPAPCLHQALKLVGVYCPMNLFGIVNLLGEACSRALQTVRELRRKYSSEEQRRNFSPYAPKTKKKPVKHTTWTITAVCLSSRQQRRVPADAKFKESLVEAGLGEKKIMIPDVDCGAAEFKELLLTKYPKLRDGGGLSCLDAFLIQSPLKLSATRWPEFPDC